MELVVLAWGVGWVGWVVVRCQVGDPLLVALAAAAVGRWIISVGRSSMKTGTMNHRIAGLTISVVGADVKGNPRRQTGGGMTVTTMTRVPRSGPAQPAAGGDAIEGGEERAGAAATVPLVVAAVKAAVVVLRGALNRFPNKCGMSATVLKRWMLSGRAPVLPRTIWTMLLACPAVVVVTAVAVAEMMATMRRARGAMRVQVLHPNAPRS